MTLSSSPIIIQQQPINIIIDCRLSCLRLIAKISVFYILLREVNTQKMFCVIVIHGRVLLFIRKNKMEYNQWSVYVTHMKLIISNGYCFHLCLHELLTSTRDYQNSCCLLKKVFTFLCASWSKTMSVTHRSWKRLYCYNKILKMA